MIEWTPELRLQVHASRAHPNPAFLVAWLRRRGLAYPLDAGACACFELAAKSWREDYSSHRTKALMRTGLAIRTGTSWMLANAAAKPGRSTATRVAGRSRSR